MFESSYIIPKSELSLTDMRTARQKAIVAGLERCSLKLGVSQDELMALVRQLNEDPKVDGFIVQLPLPDGLQAGPVLEAIDPDKDVDGFHAGNVGRLWSGQPALVACTPRGCMRLLREAGVLKAIAGRTTLEEVIRTTC